MDEGKGEERVRRRNAILLNLFLSQLFPFRSSYLTAPHRARPQAGRQGKKKAGQGNSTLSQRRVREKGEDEKRRLIEKREGRKGPSREKGGQVFFLCSHRRKQREKEIESEQIDSCSSFLGPKWSPSKQ